MQANRNRSESTRKLNAHETMFLGIFFVICFPSSKFISPFFKHSTQISKQQSNNSSHKLDLVMRSDASYHSIVFRRHLKDTSQLGIHELIGFCIFPLVEIKKNKKRHVIHQVKLLTDWFYPHTHTRSNIWTHTCHKQYANSFKRMCILRGKQNVLLFFLKENIILLHKLSQLFFL